MLEIYSKALNLSSSGCTFGKNADTKFAALAVKLIGNGTGDGETRAIFGGTTCQSNSGAWTGGGADKICVAAAKSDDDSDGNGIADSGTAASNGAIAQFVRAAEDDTAGTIVGLPTAAFDWNTFTYYSTYVAFHNSAAKDVVYVRDETGTPLYSWTVPTAGETITGTPQWISVKVGTVTTHYLFVATSAGKVYKLIDTATGDTTGTLTLDTVSTGWKTNNPFSCSLHDQHAAGHGRQQPLLGEHDRHQELLDLGAGDAVGSADDPAQPGGDQHRDLGGDDRLDDLCVHGGERRGPADQHRRQLGQRDQQLARHARGVRTNRGRPGGDQTGLCRRRRRNDVGHQSDHPHHLRQRAPVELQHRQCHQELAVLRHRHRHRPVRDARGDDHRPRRQRRGPQQRRYPYTPAGGSGDPITSAPLYYNGVLAVGSTGGKLYFLDRNTGNATTPVTIIREYQFGSSEAVSGIGFDPTANRYMVSTASSSGDGRLYYIDLIADPTPTSL